MKLKRLSLKNYRCYEEKVFLLGGVITLLDHNGAGKSVFMEALNYALDGDFNVSMVRKGCTSMSVNLEFENGFVLERRWNGSTATSAMGYGNPKSVTKEAANHEVARIFGLPIESVKVIVSSKELYTMKPAALGDFFMRHIPVKLTLKDVEDYIDDLTPEMSEEIRKVIPQDCEFGQELIDKAYDHFDKIRRESAQTLKIYKNKIAGYDFSVQSRPIKDIQDEIAMLQQKVGAAMEVRKRGQDYERIKAQRDRAKKRCMDIRDAYNNIKAVRPDMERGRMMEERKKHLIDMRMDIAKAKNTVDQTVLFLSNTIQALSKGMCPHINEKCPHDWSKKIGQMRADLGNVQHTVMEMKKKQAGIEKELADITEQILSFQANKDAYTKKIALYQEYTGILHSIPDLPEPPDLPKGNPEERLRELEKEITQASIRQEMERIREAIPETQKKVDLFDFLSREFSPKGNIMKKNLEYFTAFLEGQINKKAEKFGYKIHLIPEKGLSVLFENREGEKLDVSQVSNGERAVVIYLLTDCLNSITGIRILMIDDMECLDSGALKELIKLMKGHKEEYDHIILAGVDHPSILEIVNGLQE